MPLHTRPALMSLSGHNPSQEANCPAVGHLVMSRPTSLNNVNTIAMSPGICVRSTPNSLYDSVLWPFFRVHPRFESQQQLLDLFVASADLLLVVLVALSRLLQRKQMLRSPIALQ